MKKYSVIALALSSVATLSACQTLGDAEATIRESLPQTCELIETAYTTIGVLREAGEISERNLARADAIYAGAQTFCADPESATLADSLVRAAQAYVVITQILRESEG